MKKFITLFVCFCLILSQFSITASAMSFDVNYDFKASTVSISGQSDVNDDIDIIVFKTGDAMTPENCIYVYQLACDENGDFAMDFVMPLLADGAEYTVYISGSDKVVYTKSFNHYNVSNIITDLKGAATIEAFRTVLAENSTVFSPEFVAASDAVIDLMLGKGFDNIADYEKHFKNMTDLYNFSTEDADGMKAIYDSNAAELGFAVPDDYEELTDKTNVFAVAKKNGFDVKNITTVNDALKLGVILTLLKDGGVFKLDSVVNYVKNNAELLGITQATADNEKLPDALKEMLGDKIMTTEEFASELDDTIDELSSGSGSSGRPSSGGGGGGSSIKSGSGKVSPIVAPAPEPEKKSFTDLANVPWAVEAITSLADRNIVSGVSATEFNPDANVTREQFVKMFVLALGISTDGVSSDFSDISSSHWSYPYVSGAVSAGVVNGIGGGNFGVGQNITRQDMAAMLYRAASVCRVALTEKTSISFGDEAQIADYAKTAVEAMSKAGIINGSNGLFMPGANATRAQAAKMIYELLRLKEGA